MRLTVLELASLEKKKEEEEEEEEEEEKKKKKKDFRYFQVHFLGFYKAELESEDIFILRRIRAFHRYPFC